MESRLFSPSTSHYGYETYRANGTYTHYGEVQEGSARAKLLFDTSGTWTVEGGYMVKRIASSNLSTIKGRVFREKIDSADHDSFTVQQQGGLHTRRRGQLPAELVASATEVPKVFTVEEAAQVLQYAVKPEYSYQARKMQMTGAGIFELRFDYDTGRLKAIDIVQNTRQPYP